MPGKLRWKQWTVRKRTRLKCKAVVIGSLRFAGTNPKEFERDHANETFDDTRREARFPRRSQRHGSVANAAVRGNMGGVCAIGLVSAVGASKGTSTFPRCAAKGLAEDRKADAGRGGPCLPLAEGIWAAARFVADRARVWAGRGRGPVRQGFQACCSLNRPRHCAATMMAFAGEGAKRQISASDRRRAKKKVWCQLFSEPGRRFRTCRPCANPRRRRRGDD